METPGSRGTNHSHVTSSGASMKITLLQWPVILISALGKSGTGSAGRAQYEQTKRNARHSRERRRERAKGETERKVERKKIASHLWWVMAYCSVTMFTFARCTMFFWAGITNQRFLSCASLVRTDHHFLTTAPDLHTSELYLPAARLKAVESYQISLTIYSSTAHSEKKNFQFIQRELACVIHTT